MEAAPARLANVCEPRGAPVCVGVEGEGGTVVAEGRWRGEQAEVGGTVGTASAASHLPDD